MRHEGIFGVSQCIGPARPRRETPEGPPATDLIQR